MLCGLCAQLKLLRLAKAPVELSETARLRLKGFEFCDSDGGKV